MLDSSVNIATSVVLQLATVADMANVKSWKTVGYRALVILATLVMSMKLNCVVIRTQPVALVISRAVEMVSASVMGVHTLAFVKMVLLG